METKVNGAEVLQNVFKNLSPAIKDRVLIKALQKISKPIIQAAESKIWNHQRTGRLYRSLGEKVEKSKLLIKIGAKKTGRFKGSHAHLLENDTKERSYITKKNKVVHRTGKTKGIKYWSTSITETYEGKEGEFKNYIVESLEKEVNRITKKL